MSNIHNSHAGDGTQNAAWAAGGAPNNSDCTEEYNGTTWAAGGALNTGRYALGGAGAQNAAVIFGGFVPGYATDCTEEYDGSSWSTTSALIVDKAVMAGAGTQASALSIGGRFSSPADATTCSDEYTSYVPKVELTVGHLNTTSASIDGVSGYTTNYFESGSTAYSGSVYGTMLSGSGEVRNQLKTDGIRNTNKLVVNRSFQVPIFEANPVTGSAGELWYSKNDKAL